MPVTTRYRSAAATDPGRKRTNNEDRYVCDAPHGIFAVVDGMGGEAAGEQAAEIAASMLRARLERQTGTAAERLREAIAVANNEIYEAAQHNPEWQGMACVLTAAVVENGHATIGHVGDSRLYLLSPGQIRKITRDHSPVGEREDRGELTEREAMRHPRRNEVFRDVGSARHRPDDPDFTDITELTIDPGSALLLCSDGLSDLLASAEIRKIVEENAADPQSTVRALIAAANAAGGKDNVTVVLVAGPAYAAAQPEHVPEPEPAASRTPLLGRWAFLAYGAAAAVLLTFLVPVLLDLVNKPAQQQPAHRTWHVGPAENSDGATISSVLEKAQPGDTVVVAPGEYRELVRARSGVNILSREPHAAVLRATDRGVAIVAQGVRGGRIAGFKIAGDAQHPLATGVEVRDSDVLLDYLVVTGAATAGVEIAGQGTPVLQSSQIVNNPGAGVVIKDAASPRLAHNLIAGNGKVRPTARPGIEIAGAARPALVGNAFIDNGAEAIWAPAPGLDAAVLADNFFGVPERGTPRRRLRVIPQ